MFTDEDYETAEGKECSVRDSNPMPDLTPFGLP
jgi:hypothetical protein